MRKDLLRLARLEERCHPRSEMPPLVIVLPTPISERPRQLPSGERIVLDWLRNSNLFVEAVERITTDPADEGRRCPINSFNEDLIREYHASMCDSRSQQECTICHGLGVVAKQRNPPGGDHR